MKLTTTRHDFRSLPAAEQSAIADAVTPVFHEVMNLDRAAVWAYLDKPTALRTRVAIYRAAGEVVGTCVMHFLSVTLEGRPWVVLRGGVAFQRAWRGRSAFGPFVLTEILKWFARFPGQPLLAWGVVVHPSSYHTLTTHIPISWPRPDVETPPAMAEVMVEIARAFGMSPVEGADPLVWSTPFAVQNSASELDYWRDQTHPLIRYYMARNPGFIHGHGLLLVAPLRPGLILRVAGRYLHNRLRRKHASWQALLDQVSGGRRLDLDACAEALARAPLLADLPRDLVATLTRDARRIAVRAGQWIVRKGDRGDALYLVLSGSACVYLDETSDEVTHQLRPGDVFGEVAVVTGQPRIAGVRAAKSSEILRITAATLETVLTQSEHQTLFWHRVARIRYSNFIHEYGALARFDAGAEWTGETTEGELFLYEGTLEVVLGGQMLRLSAPALLPAAVAVRGRATEARLWWLPPNQVEATPGT